MIHLKACWRRPYRCEQHLTPKLIMLTRLVRRLKGGRKSTEDRIRWKVEVWWRGSGPREKTQVLLVSVWLLSWNDWHLKSRQLTRRLCQIYNAGAQGSVKLFSLTQVRKHNFWTAKNNVKKKKGFGLLGLENCCSLTAPIYKPTELQSFLQERRENCSRDYCWLALFLPVIIFHLIIEQLCHYLYYIKPLKSYIMNKKKFNMQASTNSKEAGWSNRQSLRRGNLLKRDKNKTLGENCVQKKLCSSASTAPNVSKYLRRRQRHGEKTPEHSPTPSKMILVTKIEINRVIISHAGEEMFLVSTVIYWHQNVL